MLKTYPTQGTCFDVGLGNGGRTQSWLVLDTYYDYALVLVMLISYLLQPRIFL